MSESILIVDDEPANVYLLENLLGEYRVTTAEDGEHMWQRIDSCDPDAIILDIMLPGRDGFQLAAELAAHERYRAVPIIFVTAKTESKDVVTGLDLGGYDYVKKPFDGDELLARLRVVLKNAGERRRMQQDVITDTQTGLYNRRFLMDYIRAETGKARRKLSTFAVAMIDIDFFKKINDTFGHQCGDYVLREFATIIKRSLRDYDIAIRYGGEEFLVIFPFSGRAEAMRVVERIKANNSAHEYRHEGRTFSFNFTCGIADLDDIDLTGEVFDVMIAVADRRLYHGKSCGRNIIVPDDEGTCPA